MRETGESNERKAKAWGDCAQSGVVRVQCAVYRKVIRVSRAIEERTLEEMQREGETCWSKTVDEAAAGVVS